MSRSLVLRVVAVIPLLVSGFISTTGAQAGDRGPQISKTPERSQAARQPKKAPATPPSDGTTTLDDVGKRKAAQSREQHDTAQQVIDNLK